MKVPPFLEPVKLWLIQYYGPDNPKRVWAWLLTAMVLMWFPQNTRRWGGIGFFVVLALYFIGGWLTDMMRNFTPN